MTDADQTEVNQDTVTLMSVHAAKRFGIQICIRIGTGRERFSKLSSIG